MQPHPKGEWNGLHQVSTRAGPWMGDSHHRDGRFVVPGGTSANAVGDQRVALIATGTLAVNLLQATCRARLIRAFNACRWLRSRLKTEGCERNPPACLRGILRFARYCGRLSASGGRLAGTVKTGRRSSNPISGSPALRAKFMVKPSATAGAGVPSHPNDREGPDWGHCRRSHRLPMYKQRNS